MELTTVEPKGADAGKSPMSPSVNLGQAEVDTLLLCSRCELTQQEAARLRAALGQPLEWVPLLNEASRHGVLGLLHATLKKQGCIDGVPAPVRHALNRASESSALRNLGWIKELVRILRALAAANVSALPFKGPVVSHCAYDDVSIREFADLDILVDASSFARARGVLVALGYQARVPFDVQGERDYLRTECALQLRHKERKYIVELHWRFSERNASVTLPVEELRARSRPMSFFGLTISTLSPEDLVLYLCVHGSKHRWERLEWTSCLAEVLRRNPQLDWNTLIERAERYNLVRILHLGLSLTHSLLDLPLPDAVRERVVLDENAQQLVGCVASILFYPKAGLTHYQERAARYMFQLRTREKWTDRFRIILYSVARPPHPEAHEWLDVPPRLAFLQYMFRPVRLLTEFSAIAWRHLVRSK